MARLYQPHKILSTNKYVERPPLWERLTVRAMVSVVFGKDYRRHIHRAKVAARRAEFERDFERAQLQRAKGVRV